MTGLKLYEHRETSSVSAEGKCTSETEFKTYSSTPDRLSWHILAANVFWPTAWTLVNVQGVICYSDFLMI